MGRLEPCYSLQVTWLFAIRIGWRVMIRFHGGFISGQTGDMGKKPETEDGDVQKFQKVEKMDVSENRK